MAALDELLKVLSEYLGLKKRLEDLLKAYGASGPEDIELKIRRGELPKNKNYEGYRKVYEDLAEAFSIQYELMTLEKKLEKMVEARGPVDNR
ncbi:MAG: hypothetical protein DRJ98_05865 [Thermoprotei archaeon]|nr:MAG: hypothetical protein DRJ98_05865 [Thermoprotei archaeon]RLF17714.1 MAG: hypothetical protein DRN06_03360 [Thermoprotei archaeon]